MRRELSVVGASIVLLAGACTERSRADRADTLVAHVDTVAVAHADSIVHSAAETVAPATPPITISTSSVVQAIACTPNALGLGDTLTLKMGTPHGNYLSIHSPNRTVYSLIYPMLGKPRRNYSLAPSEEFRNIGTFRVPADVRAIPLVYGRDTTLEPVFSQPGKYLIVLGENLASDYANRSSECTITFHR